MNILILTGYIAVWGFIHSLQASLTVKNYFRRTLGAGLNRGYRLVYNLFSLIGFLPILILMRILPDHGVYTVAAPWNYFMITGQAFSFLLLLITFLQTDSLSFVGFRQLLEEEKSPVLVTRGFYRWVRHPLYLFGLLLLWLTPVISANMLIVYVSLTVYLLIGAYFEERKLIKEFGGSYNEYRSRTPMIIPGLLFKLK